MQTNGNNVRLGFERDHVQFDGEEPEGGVGGEDQQEEGVQGPEELFVCVCVFDDVCVCAMVCEHMKRWMKKGCLLLCPYLKVGESASSCTEAAACTHIHVRTAPL